MTSVPQLLFSCRGASQTFSLECSGDFQFVHCQFAAGDDGGTTDPHPAAVDILRVQQTRRLRVINNFFVNRRIKDPDDVSIDMNRPGNPDGGTKG